MDVRLQLRGEPLLQSGRSGVPLEGPAGGRHAHATRRRVIAGVLTRLACVCLYAAALHPELPARVPPGVRRPERGGAAGADGAAARGGQQVSAADARPRPGQVETKW